MEKLSPFSNLSLDESYQSRDLEKVHITANTINVIEKYKRCGTFLFSHLMTLQVAQQVAKPLYAKKVEPTTLVPKQIGNTYTASLYSAFASLIHNKHSELVSTLGISIFHLALISYYLGNLV